MSLKASAVNRWPLQDASPPATYQPSVYDSLQAPVSEVGKRAFKGRDFVSLCTSSRKGTKGGQGTELSVLIIFYLLIGLWWGGGPNIVVASLAVRFNYLRA